MKNINNKTIHSIEECASRIYVIGKALALLSEGSENRLNMDMLTISNLGKILTDDIQQIMQRMDLGFDQNPRH